MFPVEKSVRVKCYHCGDDCIGDSIHFDEKYFCCEGCKLVYELLEENNLCTYYALNEKSGNKIKSPVGGRFSFLDDEATANQMLRFHDNEISIVQFNLPRIHCSSCIYLLERLHDLNVGVVKSEVNFLKKEITITFHQAVVSLREVVELLVRLGYEPELNLETVEGKRKISQSKKIIYQIGVTGFCFGNIMMLSFPEYLAGKGALDDSLRLFFSYLNLLLALPVLFFGAKDYFIQAWKGLREKHFNIDLPIALGILAMFSRSSYEILTHTGAGYFDSMSGLVFFLLLGKYFQSKTYETLSFERDFKAYFPLSVNVKNSGDEISTLVSKLKPKDKIIIRNEEVIPADAVLLSALASVDFSFVTGESQPVTKRKGDLIYAGGKQIGSAIELQVMKTVSQSYLTQLWNNDSFTKKKNENISKLANGISKYFTVAIILIATAAFIYWEPKNMKTALQSLTSVLIIACPCALAITVPFTLGHVMRFLGRIGFYVKNTSVIETLSKADTIVFDKTGTLTTSGNTQLNFIGAELNDEEKNSVASLVYHSTHPLSRKISSALGNISCNKVFNYAEVAGQGISGMVNGMEIKIGSAKFTRAEERSLQGRQIVFVKINSIVYGYFLFEQSYRSGLNEVIQSLRKKFHLSLLSGDGDAEKNNLKKCFQESEMHFHQLPENKMQFIMQLQKEGRTVVMAGDGLNDAGALQQADAGISITDDITQFTPASDVIMDGKILNQLPSVLKFTRAGMKIITAIFIVSLLYNIVGIYFAVQGLLSPLVAAILMPLSAFTVIILSWVLTQFAANKISGWK